MELELFKSVYVYAILVFVLVLSAIVKKKEACTCYIKAPSAFIALIAVAASSFLKFDYFTIIISLFIFSGMVGSILFGKVGKISGAIFYLVGFLILFIGVQVFKIKEIINIGFENISIFGALLAIVYMFMKKQENTTISYIIGIGLFFMTSIISGMIPLVIGGILISLSEIIMIYGNDYAEEVPENFYKSVTYFSAGLYSYGILIIPLALLL